MLHLDPVGVNVEHSVLQALQVEAQLNSAVCSARAD